MEKKHLSAIANDLLHRCALELDTSVDALVRDFDVGWTPELGDYSKKLVQFCSSKALHSMCRNIEEKINDGSFSRFTFDMMLAWEMPRSPDEESFTEGIAKEKEDKEVPMKVNQDQDDIPLFYSDLMPLLVDNEPCVGEDAFVWLASIVPLVADIINGRFTFECLTEPTGLRLHFPAYDKFINEIDRCIKHLQKQATPNGMELADDEFILHVEGTASTQRVVRHIGGTSWPGRLTLTNYALYFEASGVISYEDALKIDLSKDSQQIAKPASTGPWGAPIFDKAIVIDSSELSEGIVLEFPEITSSIRRDHWLALVKEVKLLHQFLLKCKVKSPTQAWEMHARTILGVIRLHAARKLLRLSPPVPTKFLIFSLLDELPKGDYILTELSESLNTIDSGHPCSASSILRSLNVSQSTAPCKEVKEVCLEGSFSGQSDNVSSLESAIDQAREEARQVDTARATIKALKDDGISNSILLLMEQLSTLKDVLIWFQDVLTWKRPATSILVMAASLIVLYKEWFGKAIAVLMLCIVAKMLQLRHERIKDKSTKMVVCSASDQTTMESIVSAQHGLKTVYDMVEKANIAILKIQSVLVSRTTKHANLVMIAVTGLAILVAVVPLKAIIMAVTLWYFIAMSKMGKYMQSNSGDRRLKEWWESIPVIPVQKVDNPHCPT
ncbi:uncharacterized protein LOC131168602 [Malania oleifera]|uniref:uncharacterized protein LOC131168602 n=1 Tax=Malania oleifera TaxID=397392 RepID=UPI0025AE9BFC|nr:uncharacterized protein LOC131168602 [Malania oleifera]